jgi:hypothetical protein
MGNNNDEESEMSLTPFRPDKSVRGHAINAHASTISVPEPYLGSGAGYPPSTARTPRVYACPAFAGKMRHCRDGKIDKEK